MHVSLCEYELTSGCFVDPLQTTHAVKNPFYNKSCILLDSRCSGGPRPPTDNNFGVHRARRYQSKPSAKSKMLLVLGSNLTQTLIQSDSDGSRQIQAAGFWGHRDFEDALVVVSQKRFR